MEVTGAATRENRFLIEQVGTLQFIPAASRGRGNTAFIKVGKIPDSN
jgi:hypothetical protein